MIACTSVASSGDSLFEGPSVPVDPPEFGSVAAQPANASNMIAIAANGIAAASRLRSSRCTVLPSLRFTQHLFQSQILPVGPHRHRSPANFAGLSGTSCSEISRSAPGTLFDHCRASVARVDTVHFGLLEDALEQATRTIGKLDSNECKIASG